MSPNRDSKIYNISLDEEEENPDFLAREAISKPVPDEMNTRPARLTEESPDTNTAPEDPQTGPSLFSQKKIPERRQVRQLGERARGLAGEARFLSEIIDQQLSRFHRALEIPEGDPPAAES